MRRRPAIPAASRSLRTCVESSLSSLPISVHETASCSRWSSSLGKEILEAYRKEYPGADPFRLWGAASGAEWMRLNAHTLCERKAAQNAAPVYHYVFSWGAPVLDGRPGSYHACEIAYVFDNADRCVHQTGGGPVALALSAKVSRAWVQLAHTGNPNHPGLPRWPAYYAARRAVMFFDNPCHIKIGRKSTRLNSSH